MRAALKYCHFKILSLNSSGGIAEERGQPYTSCLKLSHILASVRDLLLL